MRRDMTRRKQLYIILGLSLLVFVCLIFEAQKRGIFSTPQTSVKNASSNNETVEKKKQINVTETSDVRVLITTTNFESLFHKKIKVTSAKPFYLNIDGKKKTYAAGEVVTYSSKSKKLKGKKIIFEPSENGKLKILTITRQNINPSYRGTMQVTWNKAGLLLTNELSLEQYLYAVVPSELSTGHKLEALKAQAVCARSYAYNQIKSQRYKKYDADLEDSVACQVYNNIPEDKRSRKAVNGTKGLVLTNNKKKVLQAYYYSTSWGYSASGQDVWNTKSEISYLQEKLQSVEASVNLQKLDLSTEQGFKKFIDNKPYETYDSAADWYRWSVTISQAALSNRVDAALASCYQSNPNLVLTQQTDGTYKKETLRSLGKIKKIRVAKREKSGLVTQLELVGSKNVVKVCTQYNIRKVLTPKYEQISYKAGQASTTMSLLPSAAFYVKKISDGKQISFCFVGGGFGHGTGMSQCGAAEMAERGKSFQDILTHYYSGAVVQKMSAIG